MSKIVNILLLGIIICNFFSCGTAKTTHNGFVKKPPFKVLEATYTKWIDDGLGVNGFLIYITIDNTRVTLDTAYFRNTSVIIALNKNLPKNTYVGKLILKNVNKDMQLHIDSKKEFGNQVPDISQKIPFQLKSNQAVVSYLLNNKINYFKILNCIEILEE